MKLLTTQSGGADGGRSELTPGARELLVRFRGVTAGAAEYVEARCRAEFGDMFDCDRPLFFGCVMTMLVTRSFEGEAAYHTQSGGTGVPHAAPACHGRVRGLRRYFDCDRPLFFQCVMLTVVRRVGSAIEDPTWACGQELV
jgi:hypothetical protein